MSVDVPGWYLLGLVSIMVLGLVLPLRNERREDHVVFTIAGAVAVGVLGPPTVALVGAAVVVALPLVVLRHLVAGRAHGGPDGTGSATDAEGRPSLGRSATWLVSSAVAAVVGILCTAGVYGLLDGTYPMVLVPTGNLLRAGAAASMGWLALMAVRVLTLRWMSGPVIPRSLDPFESVLLPYVMPLLLGMPLVVASVAVYRPEAPLPSLLLLWWCVPIYAATAVDLHRRRLAQELRRGAFANQRLAAIGEVSARIVHQSRHQVGLMGWSIHRLRGLTGTDPLDAAAVAAELDRLDDAKARLSDMLTAELLHERRGPEVDGAGRGAPVPPAGVDRTLGVHGPGIAAEAPARRPSGEAVVAVGRAGVTPAPCLRTVVDDVCAQLAVEAERAGVALEVAVDPEAGSVPAPGQLHDVVFNLVDNAIDAAQAAVCVEARVQRDGGGTTASVTVRDDGPGLAEGSRAFEPFVTTKADGTGMGLAIADALVADLGGDLRYHRVDAATLFVVTMPLSVVD